MLRATLSQNLDSEVGLAVLDLRVLDIRDLDCVLSTELISTFNFASGSAEVFWRRCSSVQSLKPDTSSPSHRIDHKQRKLRHTMKPAVIRVD